MLRLVFILLVTSVTIAASQVVPVWDLDFPAQQQWSVAASDRIGKEYMIEWTRGDENLQNWTELVTYNFKPVGPEYFRVMMNRMMTTLSDGCQEFDSETIHDRNQNRVVVWSSGACGNSQAQKGVTRFQYVGDGILTLQYTFNPREVEPRFERWKQAVMEAEAEF